MGFLPAAGQEGLNAGDAAHEGQLADAGHLHSMAYSSAGPAAPSKAA